MSRTPARITQADVARAIRAAKQAGASSVRIMTDGSITIDLVGGKLTIEVDEAGRPVVL